MWVKTFFQKLFQVIASGFSILLYDQAKGNIWHSNYLATVIYLFFFDDFQNGKYDTIQCSEGLARSPGGCDRVDRCYQWNGDVRRYVSII